MWKKEGNSLKFPCFGGLGVYFDVASCGLSVPTALRTAWGEGQRWEFSFHLVLGSLEVLFSTLAE